YSCEQQNLHSFPTRRSSDLLFWKSFFTGGCRVISLFFVLIILQELGKLNHDSAVYLGLGLCVLAYYGLFILTIKRLHDFNFSGWWSLPSLVMIVPLIRSEERRVGKAVMCR